MLIIGCIESESASVGVYLILGLLVLLDWILILLNDKVVVFLDVVLKNFLGYEDVSSQKVISIKVPSSINHCIIYRRRCFCIFGL